MLETTEPGAMSPLQAALARAAKPAPAPAPVAATIPAVTLRDYQEDFVVQVRVAYRNGHKAVLLVAATGAGKCLARGTPVMLHDGTIKPAEKVAAGDLLMGPDSLPRRVETLARGREMMYRVTPTKGDSYTVNESHILSLKITGMGEKRVAGPDGAMLCSGDVHNVTVADYLQGSITYKHCAKGWRAPVEFPGGAPLPLPPYILGAWLGDGMTGKLSFTTADNEIAAEFAKYAKKNGMRFRVEQNSEWSVNVHMNSAGTRYGRGGSPFGNALRQLGIFNEKRIPHLFKTASRKDRLELLAGIIDTDGYNSGKGFDITLKSEALLDDVIFVARSLGFACYKSPVQKKCHNNGVVGQYWSCHIGGAIDQVPCRLQRKRAKPRLQKKDVLLTGITVEPVGVDDYYGFEISGPDRLFLLGDFTVTHNTVVFSYIAKSAASRGKRVLILAHRDQLIKQASKKLAENGVAHGIIMAGFTPQQRRAVQVASVQTLVRRLKAMKEAEEAAASAARAKALAAGQSEAEAEAAAKAAAAALGFDLIVVDEAHLSAAKSYMDILAAWPGALVLGVTGSPIRLDGKGLGRKVGGAFDTIVQGITIGELISRAFLVKPKVYASKMQIDLSSVKKVGGDYDADAMAEIMDKPVITGHAVTEYKRICPGVPAVAWCTNVAHARHVAEEFNAAGIPAISLSGENTSEERDRALRMLSDGRLKIITFAMLLVEGVDCPAIGAIIMLRLTMSLSSYLQTIGRGLRPVYAPGMPLDTVEQRFAAIDAGPKGRYCYVIDHVALWQKHGFADADREWDLLGEQKKKGKKKAPDETVDLCQCMKCWHVFDPTKADEQELGRQLFQKANNGAPAPDDGIFCPGCGHKLPVKVRKGPEHVDGQLAEITPEMEAALKTKNKAEVRGAKTLEELERIAAQRGYSPGWAKHTYEAKQRARSRHTGR